MSTKYNTIIYMHVHVELCSYGFLADNTCTVFDFIIYVHVTYVHTLFYTMLSTEYNCVTIYYKNNN